MKKYLIFLLGISMIFSYGCKQKQEKNDFKNVSWIRFDWEGDSIGNRYYEKLAMFVPFKIEGIPYEFSSQFDLGAPVTMIYGNSFESLLNEFPQIAEKLDTINKKHVIQGMKVGEFKNISFYLDTVKFINQNIAYFEGYGDPVSQKDFDKDTIIHIGTIGSNQFKEKILFIDFKNNKLAVIDSLSKDLEKQLIDIIIDKGRIKVPVIINGKKEYVIYDTGTSFASLFLSENNWNEYRDTTSTPDTLMAIAWGVQYPLLISKTNIEIKIGNNIFKPETIMANNLKPYYEFYKKEKIIGLMGNKLFFDKVLIIDFKKKKFGLINEL